MSSYSGGSNIIMMPTQEPFNALQNPLINAYATAMLKKKFGDMESMDKQKSKDAQYQKYLEQAKASGQEIQQGFNESGPTFKTKDPDSLTNVDIFQSSMGLGSDKATNTIAKRMGASPYEIAAKNPNAAMSLIDGQVGDINEQPITPTSMDTRSYVQGALGKLSGVNKSTPDISVEVQKALEDSKGDTNEFMNNLAELRLKHTNNPRTFNEISKMISEQQKKRVSSTFDRDIQDAMSGASNWDDLIKKHPSKVNSIMKIRNGLEMSQDTSTENPNANATPINGGVPSPTVEAPTANVDYKKQAIAELTKSGYPLTPGNIQAAMKQLSGQ